MARKSKEEMELTRLALLEAALHLFAEKGYSKTTLSDIAQRAGFTRGAVYWHFDGKPIIFNEVMAHYDAPLKKLLAKELDDAEGPKEWLRTLFSGYVKILSENKDLQTAMFVRVRKTEFPDELRPFYDQQRKEQSETQAVMKQQIKIGIEQGLFRDELDADIAAGSAMAFLIGLFGLIFTQSVPLKLSELNGIIEIFMAGLER